ncbi:MAG: hypothetical protein HYZ85_01325 [Candidatus Omnitrophica bacterium]|nr:hypothetical protein [Candidatus Omnitrophota bacterium]
MSDQPKVAIITPFYKRDLSPEETISLRHLNHFLGPYDKYLVMPEGKKGGLKGFQKTFVPQKYFKSLDSYSHLLLSKKFYQRFARYDYILIYQLDSLVFSDQLMEWCVRGYDYIGAPWLKEFGFPWTQGKDLVGNGGFSLRKVDKFIEILENYNHIEFLTKRLLSSARRLTLRLPKRIYKAIVRSEAKTTLYDLYHNPYRLLNWLNRGYSGEDLFWSVEASQYVRQYIKAPVEQALAFSFEANPASCFKKNHNTLPFGCHAWPKNNRNFWEAYLLQ